MTRLLTAILFTLASSAALAQSGPPVKQSGNVTPGHVPVWLTTGVLGDGGTAASGALSSLGVTNNGGPGICINSGPITGPYNQLCWSVGTSTPSTLTLQNFGGAAQQSLVFNINGTSYPFPFTVGGIVGPGTTVVNDFACWNNTVGTLLKDCGTIAIPPATLGYALLGTGNSTPPAFSGFTPTGTGAITRTWPSKVGDAVNAVDFGAAPAASGNTNATAINNALANPYAILTPGAYSITSAITIPAASALDLQAGTTLTYSGGGTINTPFGAGGGVIDKNYTNIGSWMQSRSVSGSNFFVTSGDYLGVGSVGSPVFGWSVIGDTAQAGTNFVNGTSVYHSYGGSSATGGRQAIQTFLDQTAATKTGASFQGTIAGTVLTVNTVSSGTVSRGDTVGGDGVTVGTIVCDNVICAAGGSGSGGTGTYNVNLSSTVSSPVTMLSNPNPRNSYVGGTFYSRSQSGDGGAGTSLTNSKGSYFGINPVCIMEASATFVQGCTGGEFDVFMSGSASVALVTGAQIVGFHSAQGTTFDAGLAFFGGGASQYNATNDIGWQNIFLITDLPFNGGAQALAHNPLNHNTTLFKVNLSNANNAFTVTGGIDWSQLRFSGNQITGPQFTVDGNGVVTNNRNIVGLGTTSTDGFVAQNSIAATGLAQQQFSPRLRLTGFAWTGAASQEADWIIETRPINGANPIGSQLSFSSSINGAPYVQRLYLDQTGNTVLPNSGGFITLGGSISAEGAAGAGTGIVSLTGGDSTHTGFVAWFNPAATRTAFMGFDTSTCPGGVSVGSCITLNLNSIPYLITGGATVELVTGVGTTTADGIVLLNNTAAALNAQQFSPVLRLTGEGWDTAANLTREVDWALQTKPTQVASGLPQGKLSVLSEVNGGGFTEIGFWGSTGGLYTASIYGGVAPGSSLLLQSTNTNGPGCGGCSGPVNDSITLATGGAGSRIKILSNGNIGFGTETNPQGSFVVSNNIAGYASATGLFNMVGSDAASAAFNVFGFGGLGSGFNFFNARGTAASQPNAADALQAGDAVTVLAFRGYTSATSYSRIADILVSAVDNLTSTTLGSSIAMRTIATGTNSLTQALLAKSGVIIGTSTVDPTSGNLSVGNAASTSFTLTAGYGAVITNGSSGGQVQFLTGNTLQAEIHGDASGLTIANDNSLPVTISAGTGSNILFEVNAVEKMRLTSAGLVAIATTAVITTSDIFAVAGQMSTSGAVFLTGLSNHAGDASLCIGTGTANTNHLVSSDTSGTICGISAARFKTILGDIDPATALEKVSAISTAYWRYRPGFQDNGSVEHVGPIADEIAAIDERCAVTQDGSLVNYSDRCLEGYLIASIKALKADNDNLRAIMRKLAR